MDLEWEFIEGSACDQNIRQYLEEHKKRDGIVLITTHDEAELDICTRMVMMKNGVFVEKDTGLRGAELLKELQSED